jgi:hypothetical protein
MNKLYLLLSFLSVLVLLQSCKKDSNDDDQESLKTPSPMGVVGTTITSSSIPVSGVSGLSASVVSLSNGVSSYSGTGVITNSTIKNILSNIPGITINGDNVTATGFQFKQAIEGIESFVGLGPGIIVNFNSGVGATYPVGSTGRTRTVISKSTTDDYYYGGLMIKVMKIEEPTPGLKSLGVSKITYWANHKFGLVGVQFDLNDDSSLTFPMYCSATNSK